MVRCLQEVKGWGGSSALYLKTAGLLVDCFSNSRKLDESKIHGKKEVGSRGRARTYNSRINSAELYH
jgi:hypothetical protein